MNIIWKRPDGSIAVTHLTNEAVSIEHEAAKLLERGDIPSDWDLVATAIELPTDRHFRDAWTWTTTEPVIDIDVQAAQEITKNRLRAARAPLLAQLDVDYMKALETGNGAAAIIEKKNQLRDVTKLVDGITDLEVLKGMGVE